MDLEKTIKNEVEKTVMQAINDLCVKAIIREQIVEAGITKEELWNSANECIDSYVRSKDVPALVHSEVNRLVKDSIKRELNSFFSMYSYSHSPTPLLKALVEKEIQSQLDNYKMDISITKKEGE